MVTQRKSSSRSSGNSSGLGLIIPIILVSVVLIGGGVYFFWDGPKQSVPIADLTNPVATSTPASDNTSTSSVPKSTPDSTGLEQMSVEQLLKEASKAFREGRREAPAGNNALEFYTQVLEKDSQNKTARNALLEIFPLTTDSVGKAINSGQLNEATRLMNLLAKSDPDNYTLNILRSKLQGKRKQIEREEAQAAAATAEAEARAASNTQTNNANAGRAETTSSAPPANNNLASTSDSNVASNSAAATPSSPKAAVASPTAPPAASTASLPVTSSTPSTPKGETREVQVVNTVPPEYPRDAIRKRQQGWVEVGFTVTAEGQATDIQVVNADPPKVFDREAIRAVQRWSFKPKMQDGVAVPGKVQRRLEFKLDG